MVGIMGWDAGTRQETRGNRPRLFPLPVLAFAVLLHLALLLIPGSEKPTTTLIEDHLEVQLVDVEPQFEVPEIVPAQPPQIVVPDPPAQAPLTEPEPSQAPAVVEESRPDEISETVTVARLIESISELEWKERSNQTVQISRKVDSELYRTLSRPVVSLDANLFDDAVLPVKTEIVDRWQEPTGVHRVVIKTPTGHTLCGRQEPVNPMSPWTQMPMLFNKCAGGGKRKAPRTPVWRDSPTVP